MRAAAVCKMYNRARINVEKEGGNIGIYAGNPYPYGVNQTEKEISDCHKRT